MRRGRAGVRERLRERGNDVSPHVTVAPLLT